MGFKTICIASHCTSDDNGLQDQVRANERARRQAQEPRTKGNFHKCNIKHLKTVMPSGKHKSAMKHKHLSVKHKNSKNNAHSARPL